MAILAGAILVGSIFAAIAHQDGPSSVIAPFDFSCPGFAVLRGLLLFAEVRAAPGNAVRNARPGAGRQRSRR